MIEYSALNYDDWVQWLQQHNEKPFHAKQIVEWLYQKFCLDWHKMSNLSASLREKLSKSIKLPLLELVKVTESADKQTFKFLWRLSDKSLVESVLIYSGDRRTLCISSQVGCPAKCAFCASGQNGFKRNLKAGEIVEQVLQINKWLQKDDEKISHLVFMGMGEPLKNYDPVINAIRLLIDPKFLNFSQRRITISTVGIVEGIKRLSKEDLRISLVLSLHAPNQHIRKKIIPYARKYPLEDIMSAMDDYFQKTKRDITYEYILIEGVNDHPDHAQELAHLLKGKQCTVNLIPYNPVKGVNLKRPDKKAIKNFRSVLYGSKVVNTCRYTKGDDIAATCGQLAMQHEKTSSDEPKLSPLNII